MKYKSAFAVMVAFFMLVSAVPLSESVADTPENVYNGFVFESTPTQEAFDRYLCSDEYIAMNVMYALGLYNGCFNYNVILSDIKYDAAASFSTYYFDTDETGVEQFISYVFNESMNVKFVATVDEYYGGYDLFLENLVGDVSQVKGYIGDTFNAGDTITVEAKIDLTEYEDYDETDMLRADGKYIVDSWDLYYAYVMKVSGTAVFSINGKTTETTFETYDSENYTSLCNWRYLTDISDVKIGDAFDYDRNNRLMYNSHFCGYKLGNGIYTISDTESTSSSYMDMKASVDESFLYTSAQLSDVEYLYDYMYEHSSSEISQIGSLNKSYSDAVFKIATDNVNNIEQVPVTFYSQDEVDDLNKTINDLNKKADENKTTVCILLALVIVLIVVLIALLARKHAI